MIRKQKLPRLGLLLALALVGTVAGLLLGELAADGWLGQKDRAASDESRGYARHSANPDALVADPTASAPCFNCADSYGAAARLRAQRTERADAAFRDVSAVDLDSSRPEPADDYRYGGRFPDIAPPADAGEDPLSDAEAAPE